ncbi:serine/threonine protein kinase [Curvibacter sp. CHRR-16]|uniref:serine/threonine protein kinase n=1 Tax=Curvibacter sp. CHRR-16 TaxID=2835872 RepID=UPI001BDA566D|nr:serine/threonine protein kinase [Curvibacter sp. CHRR-16]MBT0570502.1 serine/threonine protein kinase [Curvibacter sp. CHRR-16]
MRTDSPSPHPFDALTPDLVLDALDSVGLRGDGRLYPLSSYENRVYLVQLEDGPSVVAKFYRPARWSDAQIQEEHDFALELAAAEVPMVAPVVLHGQTLHHHGGFAFAVSPLRGGRYPELDDFEVLEWTGRFIARLHSVGERRAFVHRPSTTLQTLGIDSVQWLLEHDMVPLDVRSDWQSAAQDAINFIAGQALLTGSSGSFPTYIRLHGDCHAGNILWTPPDAAPAGQTGGPHFVDLDDCRMGPAMQDLWMLLSGERRQRTEQLCGLLDGYEQVRPFPRQELVLIEPLRTLRLLHYSAWLARRWGDPAFAQTFAWFGSSDYWRNQTQQLHAQIEAMHEPALVV